MSNPFEDRKLRDWFISCCFAVEGELPDQVVTDGAGPFDEYEFDEFLQRQGMAILGIRGGASSDCLVLGRDGWDETEIDDFLEARRGSSLRVYSQEMMLAFLMTGTDPFEDPELCWAFGKGHPALEYLQEWGFEWPTTGIVPSWGDGDTGEPETWPQVGLLKHYGYKVGESGKPRSQRRKVLRQVFTARELHRVKSKEHMQEWGEPSSARRLQKMANCIASFVRNHTRKRNAPTKAICDWEEDLAWLREEFYQGSFQWPSTYIYR